MGSMNKNTLLTGSIVVAFCFGLTVACKTAETTVTKAVAAVDVNKVSAYQSSGTSTADEIAAARAGLGCSASNIDQPAIDTDAKTGDVETREIKTTHGKDVLTSLATYTVVSELDTKLLLQKKLLSYASDKIGEMLLASVDSALSCDTKISSDKACGGTLTAQEQGTALKNNMSAQGWTLISEQNQTKECRVTEIDRDANGKQAIVEADDLGTYQLHSGHSIKVLSHTKTVTGKIVCREDLNMGHGTIVEQTLLSRDVVGVAELVACGGVPVVKAKTVSIDSGAVIFSQRTEIIDTKVK